MKLPILAILGGNASALLVPLAVRYGPKALVALAFWFLAGWLALVIFRAACNSNRRFEK